MKLFFSFFFCNCLSCLITASITFGSIGTHVSKKICCHSNTILIDHCPRFQGKNDRVPTSCCKFPSPTCGFDMTIKNPVDVINLVGCTGLNFSYSDREKVVGGVGLAIAFTHLLATIGCIVFLCCFNAARGLSTTDALKGKEPSDEDQISGGSEMGSTSGSTRRSPGKKPLHASQEELTAEDDLPTDASKDLRDKSK